jgi:hypothetical protein
VRGAAGGEECPDGTRRKRSRDPRNPGLRGRASLVTLRSSVRGSIQEPPGEAAGFPCVPIYGSVCTPIGMRGHMRRSVTEGVVLTRRVPEPHGLAKMPPILAPKGIRRAATNLPLTVRQDPFGSETLRSGPHGLSA